MPMDEKKLLENFAKILGSSAQEELKKIEERKLKEEHIVKSFDVALSKLVTPQNDTIKEIFEKKIVINPPELKTTNKQHVLEATNLVSQAVTATNVPENGKKTETDLINSSLRKEIEVIKKNVSDFHKIIHEQSRKISLAGSSHGGGEVNLRYLDDIDRSSIRQGHFLTYDDSTKKFMFSQIAEGNVDLSHIDQQLTPGANGVYNLGSPTDYWANVYADSLILDGGGIQSTANIDILASNSIWSFGTDSVLTTPNYGKIIFNSYGLGSPEHYIESTQGFHIHASDAVIIDVGANTYSFGNDGVFTLPEGGDIQNSSGHSVITDLLHVSSDIIPAGNTYSLGNTENYWNTLYANFIAVPNGSLIASTLEVSPVINNANLSQVVAYSTGAAIPVGTYGNDSEIPAPWTVYQLQAVPTIPLQVNDLVAGTGVPLHNYISYVGTGSYANVIIANTTFTVTTPPEDGTLLTFTRDVINPSLSIATTPNTNIALTPGAGGIIVTDADIVPKTTNNNRLGTPAKRFKELWLGPGTLYVADETLGVDQALGAKDGNFYIKGGAGFQVGEFTLRDNQITITDSTRDILFGTTLATGNVVFNRPIAVKTYDTGKTSFSVSRAGLVNIVTPSTILTTQAALSITGASSEVSQPRNFTGTLIQGTAQDGQPARVGFDAFGANTYVAIAGRGARGTVQSPSGTQANDTIMRLSMQGWTTDGNQYAGSIGRINMQAVENFYTANTGTKITFQLTPAGSNTIQSETVAFTSNGINFTNNPYGAIKFNDGSFQNTAFNKSSAVTSITTGTGLTRTADKGDVGIDSTAVLSILGTANQISVSNTGGNYTLTLPQNIGTDSSVQFDTLTVNNFIITGATSSAETLSISDKVLHLAFDSTTEAQLVGGGITLGNTSSSYYVSFLYDLNHNRWDTSTTGLKTSDLFSANATMANIIVSNTAHFGTAYLYNDYPNALIQVDEDLNSYAQIISQNHNAGTQVSTDYVAVNNLGTDSSYYIDMGINGSNYSNTGWTISGPNDAYLYNANGNLTIGTATENKIIKFHVGGTLAENQIAQLDTTGLYVDGDITAVNYYGTLKGTANNTLYVGSVTAANVVSNSQLIANLANYQTTAGLSANVAKLTSNNTSYIGSVTASDVVSNSQLIANLANYQTTAGLSANVAKLTSNNATYAYGKTEIGLNVNTSLVSNNTLYVGSVTAANVVSNSQLSSNLANYAFLAGATFTGNVVVNANLTTNAIFTTGNSSVNTVISGSTVTTANLTSKYIIANSSSGSSKQVLMSGGNSANVYWQWTNQHFALGANLSLNATSTSAQSLFGVGVQVANNSRYAISMIGSMTYTGGGPAGGGNIGFGFGGTANLASVYYQTTTSVDNTENGGTNPQLAAFRLTSGFIANSSTNQVTNFNKPYLMFNIQGVISVANGGTLIPQYDTDHASTTLTLLALSSVSLELLGDDSAANSVTGTWA